MAVAKIEVFVETETILQLFFGNPTICARFSRHRELLDDTLLKYLSKNLRL
jgi:hypothetical protein